MRGVQKAMLPGILLSSLLLVLINQLVFPRTTVKAATEVPVAAQEVSNDQHAATDCEFTARYPDKIRPWCGLIEKQAREYGVDPLLVAAVMLMESGGQPEVISRSGAVGLMQVMPRDGLASAFQCVNGPCFANRPTIEELKDPEFNVEYGVRMLSGLINKYGNTRDALKAYGPGDVEYWYADKVLALHSQF